MKNYKVKIMKAELDQPTKVELVEEVEIESTVAKIQELCSEIETEEEEDT